MYQALFFFPSRAKEAKKRCCVAVGHDGFVDIFIWCQSHHIIAYVVPGHVDVPHVLILLLDWQLEEIFASQGFFLCPVFAIVVKLALSAVMSSKVWIAFARFMVKSMRPVNGASRLSGKGGSDCTWRGNHEWSIPVENDLGWNWIEIWHTNNSPSLAF